MEILAKRAANHHSQSTLRPPLPPPHNHHTLSHQSANSLNRNTLRGGRNPIHAPAPGTGDGPTTPESVQLQDSWVLNSNVPLETSIWLCSGGGVAHGSEPVAVNEAQSSTQTFQHHPPAQIGPSSLVLDGRDWVGWLELLELVTGLEPGRQSQRVTPSRWQGSSSISL
ncbi:unnamed protein product [Pleuronectes platessa]|uniref:Teneurin N-terminal domain-containing protein n=1 Tax=Pleuronectes platessa TaxID=8262 RepID=A0A9N7V1F0_PLEPL|nr:unnamed protein product [Pleuronectes platessa]